MTSTNDCNRVDFKEETSNFKLLYNKKKQDLFIWSKNYSCDCFVVTINHSLIVRLSPFQPIRQPIIYIYIYIYIHSM